MDGAVFELFCVESMESIRHLPESLYRLATDFHWSASPLLGIPLQQSDALCLIGFKTCCVNGGAAYPWPEAAGLLELSDRVRRRHGDASSGMTKATGC